MLSSGKERKWDSFSGRRLVWSVILGPSAIPLAYGSDNGKVHVSLPEQEIIAAHYLAIPKAQSPLKQPDSRRLHQTRESPMRVWLRTKYPSFNLLFFFSPLFFFLFTPLLLRGNPDSRAIPTISTPPFKKRKREKAPQWLSLNEGASVWLGAVSLKMGNCLIVSRTSERLVYYTHRN